MKLALERHWNDLHDVDCNVEVIDIAEALLLETDDYTEGLSKGTLDLTPLQST